MSNAKRKLRHSMTASAWLVVACSGPQEPPPIAGQELPANQVMIDVKHTFTVSGVRSALGRFDTVFVHEDSSKMYIRGVNLEMFNTIGELTATLTSDAGELNESTDAMVARENVLLVLVADSSVIETEELHYDPSTHRVWSTVQTTRRLGDCVLTADGFNADDQFHRIEYDRQRGCVEGIELEF